MLRIVETALQNSPNIVPKWLLKKLIALLNIPTFAMQKI
jgi:hypothetical protein